jgi:prolipoprotein diacylglyceryltransferase/protein-S-isoprenylcysteine O-methyltransferase Ste14
VNQRLGKILYGSLFAVGLPALLVLWARAAASNVGLPAVVSPAGWSIAAAGLGLVAWAIAALAVFGRGLPMNAYPPPVFVSRGPYAVVAHPIYLGFVLACGGVAIGAGSAAGLWLVTPVAALGCAALVLGYEGPDLAARFAERPRPFLRLPAGAPESPSAADRLSAYALVLLPWLVLYEAVQTLGIAPDAVALLLPGEARWQVWESTELVYASTYFFVALAPLAAVSRADLRRFMVRGWAATALVVLLWLVLPVAAPPRPFTPHGSLGALLDFERGLDSPACAFPSFHVAWAFLAAPIWASRFGHARALAWGWAWAIGASCVTTGMHTVADVAAGLAAALLILRLPQAWEALRAAAERLANSWHEWDFGAVRVINHGGWAALGTFAGIALASTLAGGRGTLAVLLVAFSGLVGAGLWAQFVEGSPRLLRPYGYYGGILGVVLGSAFATLLTGADAWILLGAFAVAGPWIQAAGRVRCLVQGCCHGAPAPESIGIRYVHPRSRVCRLADLSGVPVHPTPLYSILWNGVLALLGARLWAARAPLPVIVGAYLILAGLGRFVEESRRGEPQTPIIARLRLYQWIAAGTVAAGAVLTCLPATIPTPAPEPTLLALAAGAAFALATWFALGVDFPRSNRRFARLV